MPRSHCNGNRHSYQLTLNGIYVGIRLVADRNYVACVSSNLLGKKYLLVKLLVEICGERYRFEIYGWFYFVVLSF